MSDAPRSRLTDLVAALAFLDDDAQITISVRAGDLRAALEAKAGGPSVVTAEQAALHIGRTPEFWRRAAKAGKLSGAWQDNAHGPWRLPREACEQYLRSLQRRRTSARAAVIPFDGGKARGPRTSKATRPPAA
jgi:hypothetical protein